MSFLKFARICGFILGGRFDAYDAPFKDEIYQDIRCDLLKLSLDKLPVFYERIWDGEDYDDLADDFRKKSSFAIVTDDRLEDIWAYCYSYICEMAEDQELGTLSKNADQFCREEHIRNDFADV